MATKGSKYPKNRAVAKLVTENGQPCIFCQQDVDDEVIYGKLYSLGDIQCHYFCVLLSCCLVQKGRDSEGLFGFLYKDILAEVERSKKHKCSYCGRGGASLGCSVSTCRKQFHLPCGRQKNAVSLFYGNYKSFCELHAPKQKISDSVMVNAKARKKRDQLIKAGKIPIGNGEADKQTEEGSAMVCVICYEEVQGYPTTQTFWPPCCGRDAWLHRSCLQRMALSAGMHYLKCPLCNDKDNFYEAVCDQGYYLPDRDAAWELEQNAFAEMYSRDTACAAVDCKCPFGRTHDELGIWDIKLCLLCGSWGMHAHCSGGERPVCGSCRPAAEDIEQLETRLTAVILAEQAREQRNARSGPVMPSRMSLRRTKGRVQAHSSSSSSQYLPTHDYLQMKSEPQSPTKDTEDVSLKTPRRPKLLTPNLKDLETKLLSPIKMLEQSYMEKGGGGDVVVTNEVIEKIKLKFSKPKPLSAKKKIVNEILDDLFKNVFKEAVKSKDPVKEWNSPKKSLALTHDVCEESKKIPPLILNTDEIQTGASINDENPEANLEMVEDDAKIKHKLDEEKCDEEDNADINTNKISTEESKVLVERTDEKENDPNYLNDSNAKLNVNDTPTEHIDTAADKIDAYIDDDESTNSTFQLPAEFVAESDDSLPIFDTPKKVKTVDIKQDSSIEISEHNEMVNIDVTQIDNGKENEFIKSLTPKSPFKNTMFTFKFSPTNKDKLEDCGIDMDVESFKEQYLKEVDRSKSDFKQFIDDIKINTVHEANDANAINRKRKLEMKEIVGKKRKKTKLKIKIKTNNPQEARDRKRAKKMKRIKELQKKVVRDKHVMIKIKLKDASKNRIKKSMKKQKVKTFTQYVLKYSPIQTDKIIAKPEDDVSPIKRKYTKVEKSVDNLVQTSIQSFFKAK